MLGAKLLKPMSHCPPTAARAGSPGAPVIELRHVVKIYETAAGPFTALRGIDLRIGAGEFVAVIGKSGSGKSTLVNMIAGIDRPSAGEVMVAGTSLTPLSEGGLAGWRGRSLGIVFQFFQLLPTLSLVENVMLPMDFCNTYKPRERRARAMELLGRVGMEKHADKLPSAVSGGQQQRVAIARALANDPPLILADEPTGNLDSKMAESVFALFEELARAGKTIVMVTHDDDLARRAKRAVIIADGAVVNQYIAEALPALDLDQLAVAAAQLTPRAFAPGSYVIRQGDDAEQFYIIAEGTADVLLRHPNGQEIVVNQMHPGQYFGEVALLRGGKRTASVRASTDGPLTVLALDRDAFAGLLSESEATRETIDGAIRSYVMVVADTIPVAR